MRPQEYIGIGFVESLGTKIAAIGSVLVLPVRPISETGQTGIAQSRANGSKTSS